MLMENRIDGQWMAADCRVLRIEHYSVMNVTNDVGHDNQSVEKQKADQMSIDDHSLVSEPTTRLMEAGRKEKRSANETILPRIQYQRLETRVKTYTVISYLIFVVHIEAP
jgi:hypothetical protein